MPSRLMLITATAAKASFISKRSISSRVRPAFLTAFSVTCEGTMGMFLGGPATVAHERMVPRGSFPNSSVFSPDIKSTLSAPSFIPGAFPAVTVPPLAERRFQPRKPFEGRVRTGKFIHLEQYRFPFPLQYLDRHDLPLKAPRHVCLAPSLLAP